MFTERFSVLPLQSNVKSMVSKIVLLTFVNRACGAARKARQTIYSGVDTEVAVSTVSLSATDSAAMAGFVTIRLRESDGALVAFDSICGVGCS